MRTALIIIAVFIGLIVLKRSYTQATGSAEIEYRGEKIRLTKKYSDYDTYKDDPNNIQPSELPKIERMMTEVKIGPSFKDWADFVNQEFTIVFPGYGCGGGPRVFSSGREFVVSSVEIPQAEKERIFVLEKLPDGSLRMVDDFVSESQLYPEEVHLIDGKLIYFSRDKARLRETKL